MQAQTTKRLRENRNPQIEGLMKYAKSMGVNVWEFYSRNYRSMSFHFSEYNDSDPHDNPALLIDSIKSTFLGLADEAADKYLWEKDKEGEDSIYYTLTLGKYNNAGKIRESKMETNRISLPCPRGFSPSNIYLTNGRTSGRRTRQHRKCRPPLSVLPRQHR